MPVKRKKKVIITTAAVIVLLILAALWFFTPISFLNVKPQGTYQINLTVNGHEMTATMENNTSSWALHRLLEHGPRTIRLRDYEGMEKVGIRTHQTCLQQLNKKGAARSITCFIQLLFVVCFSNNKTTG